jgi:hypothetical protein
VRTAKFTVLWRDLSLRYLLDSIHPSELGCIVERVLLLRLLRSTLLGLALTLGWLTLSSPAPASAASDDDAADSSSSGSDDAAEAPKQSKHDEPKPAEKAKDEPTNYGHMGQFGLRAGLVVGYRMIIRYTNSPFCVTPDGGTADSQPTFCGHGAPLATDLGLSFGVLDFLEPFVWTRLGLAPERQTDTNPLRVIGAGVRIYTMSDAMFKIFIEPAVGLELESGRGTPAWQLNNPVYKKDFMFKIAAGPQFDFARYVGAYVTGGVTAAFVRSFGASFDLSFGVQGRLP